MRFSWSDLKTSVKWKYDDVLGHDYAEMLRIHSLSLATALQISIEEIK